MNDDNLAKLSEARLIKVSKLPEPHARVVEELTEDEMRVILEVAERLEEADAQLDREHAEVKHRFTTFMIF